MYRRNRGKRILAAIVFGSLFVAVMGAVVMFLWNNLIPEIFTVPEITFWQALGLLILARILFGGFGGRGFRRHGDWKRKWMHMSPEERARFKHRWRDHMTKKYQDEESKTDDNTSS